MWSSYSGTAETLERDYVLSGIAMGDDAKRSKDLTLGLLGGYGQTNLTADSVTTQSYKNSSGGGFLGMYGQKRWGDTSVEVALYGGVQSFQQQRFVNDNLAYLGSSSTSSSYRGWWLAPEAGIRVNEGDIQGWSVLPTAGLCVTPSNGLDPIQNLAGWSDNATVNGRDVAIGQSFVGVGTRKTLITTLGKTPRWFSRSGWLSVSRSRR
jgi:outer membrane autotransporter protein